MKRDASIKQAPVVLAVMAVLVLGGCSNMTPTEQRVLSGGAIGAASGAAITAMTGGCVACGAAVGGVVGAAGGYIYDEIKKKGN